MKQTSIGLLVILFLISTSLTLAQPPGGPRWGGAMKEQGEHLKDALKLTEQQQAQVQKLRLDLERKQTQVHSKIQVSRLDMKEILLSDNPDRSALEKSLKQVSDLQQQLKLNQVEFWFSAKGILTADQQKVWKKHLAGMMGRERQNMRGDMGGRGPKCCRGRMGCGDSMMPAPPDEVNPK